jgi:hypothetical protein
VAKTIDKFKTLAGNPVTLVVANIFSVKPYEGPQLPVDDLARVPAGAVLYDVMSSAGAHEWIVVPLGMNISSYVIEATE